MSSLSAPKSGHIPSLDGIRAISIAIVFIGHAGLPQLIRDASGVTIFFFLSGFLITTLLHQEQFRFGRVSLRNFYLRRVFRILPVMYVVLGAAILISLAGWLPNEMTLVGAAASLAQMSNYWIIFNGRDGLPAGMNALWSLNVEEHFYLIFPLLQILLWRFVPRRKHQAIILGSLCAFMLLWRCFLVFVAGAGDDRLYLATDTRADSILLGALMAVTWNPVFGRSLAGGKHPWLMLAGGATAFAIARILPGPLMLTVGYTLEGLGLFLIFTSVISHPETLAGRFLNWRPVAFVGLVSYSLYLVHRPILLLVDEHLPFGIVASAAIALAASLLVSYALLRIVERPLGELRKKFHQRPTSSI